MRPTLAPGDYLIVTKARAQKNTLCAGFVVLVDLPKYGLNVKRIKTVEETTVRLIGDSPESTDTADMGDVEISRIKGRARYAINPKGIKRL